MDPDSAIFVIYLIEANKKLSKFFCLLLFESAFTSFFKDKVIRKSQNSMNQGISYYFCSMIVGSGFAPLTYGSGSRRSKTYGSGSASQLQSLSGNTTFITIRRRETHLVATEIHVEVVSVGPLQVGQ